MAAIDLRRHDCEEQLCEMADDAELSAADQIAAMTALCDSLHQRAVEEIGWELASAIKKMLSQ